MNGGSTANFVYDDYVYKLNINLHTVAEIDTLSDFTKNFTSKIFASADQFLNSILICKIERVENFTVKALSFSIKPKAEISINVSLANILKNEFERKYPNFEQFVQDATGLLFEKVDLQSVVFLFCCIAFEEKIKRLGVSKEISLQFYFCSKNEELKMPEKGESSYLLIW